MLFAYMMSQLHSIMTNYETLAGKTKLYEMSVISDKNVNHMASFKSLGKKKLSPKAKDAMKQTWDHPFAHARDCV